MLPISQMPKLDPCPTRDDLAGWGCPTRSQTRRLLFPSSTPHPKWGAAGVPRGPQTSSLNKSCRDGALLCRLRLASPNPPPPPAAAWPQGKLIKPSAAGPASMAAGSQKKRLLPERMKCGCNYVSPCCVPGVCLLLLANPVSETIAFIAQSKTPRHSRLS